MGGVTYSYCDRFDTGFCRNRSRQGDLQERCFGKFRMTQIIINRGSRQHPSQGCALL